METLRASIASPIAIANIVAIPTLFDFSNVVGLTMILVLKSFSFRTV